VGSLDTLRLCSDVCLQDLLSPVSWMTSGSVPKNASMKVDSRLISSLAFVEISEDLVEVVVIKPNLDSCCAGVWDLDPLAFLLSSGAVVLFLSSLPNIFV
jgi:hypothetical protein